MWNTWDYLISYSRCRQTLGSGHNKNVLDRWSLSIGMRGFLITGIQGGFHSAKRGYWYEKTDEVDRYVRTYGWNYCGGVNGSSYAADEAVYELNPITVTATRYEKKDVDIGASTQTFTAKEIEQTGADNMSVALQYLDGVVQSGMGPNGASNSSMTSKAVIRGVTNGTVVMINGTPINWRGLYNLENIPTSSVERVEVVRGGWCSTLW